MPPQPAESDGALDTGAELLATAGSRQKWLIDAFDEDTAILHRFDAVRGLDDPARGGIGIGEGLPLDEFHAATSMSALPGYFRHQLVPLLRGHHLLRYRDI